MRVLILLLSLQGEPGLMVSSIVHFIFKLSFEVISSNAAGINIYIFIKLVVLGILFLKHY